MLDLAALGRRLQEERRRLGLSQEALAQRVGISRASIATYERGRTPPDVAFMESLRAIGIRTQYVVSGNRESDDAAQQFDWQLARELVRCIVEYAQEQDIELAPSQLIDLMQVLYPSAIHSNVVDKSAVAAAVRLAA